jgi:hypothetical protein
MSLIRLSEDAMVDHDDRAQFTQDGVRRLNALNVIANIVIRTVRTSWIGTLESFETKSRGSRDVHFTGRT